MIGLWYTISWPIRTIWPNRDKWLAEFGRKRNMKRTPDLHQTISKDRRLFWISPEPQLEGDRYRIDFGKSRGRIIDGVEFYEQRPSNEFPNGWILHVINDWGTPVIEPIRGRGKRIVAEFPPTRAHGIEVIIQEPMLREDGRAYHWRIENVYFREVKLFGRWLRKRI